MRWECKSLTFSGSKPSSDLKIRNRHGGEDGDEDQEAVLGFEHRLGMAFDSRAVVNWK
jgi:hypothetical protein